MAKHSPKRGSGQFAAIPHAVLKSRKYASMDAWAAKLLLDVMVQYTGRNNGDFTIAWSVLKERGWRSKGTIARAERDLRSAGFIIQTRQGGSHVCSLYAVSWLKIDECIDRTTGLHKHDRHTLTPPGGWKDGEEPKDPPPPKTKRAFPMSTAAVPMCTEEHEYGTHTDRKPDLRYTRRTENA